MNTDPSKVSPSLILPLESFTDRLDVDGIFPRPQPLEVELGSGDGSFLIRYASQQPEVNFLGVERLLGRLRKVDRKAQRAGLLNVRAVRIEASYFLQYLLPKKSVNVLHIYFPDPWPKRKHRRHRLINEDFPKLAREVLIPGGIVYLRTDDADYFAQMENVFVASPFFSSIETPPAVAEVLTDFERGFMARGVQTRRLALQLTAD